VDSRIRELERNYERTTGKRAVVFDQEEHAQLVAWAMAEMLRVDAAWNEYLANDHERAYAPWKRRELVERIRRSKNLMTRLRWEEAVGDPRLADHLPRVRALMNRVLPPLDEPRANPNVIMPPPDIFPSPPDVGDANG
jgi:hypothetical protein